jgi:hypothetical protein
MMQSAGIQASRPLRQRADGSFFHTLKISGSGVALVESPFQPLITYIGRLGGDRWKIAASSSLASCRSAKAAEEAGKIVMAEGRQALKPPRLEQIESP